MSLGLEYFLNHIPSCSYCASFWFDNIFRFTATESTIESLINIRNLKSIFYQHSKVAYFQIPYFIWKPVKGSAKSDYKLIMVFDLLGLVRLYTFPSFTCFSRSFSMEVKEGVNTFLSIHIEAINLCWSISSREFISSLSKSIESALGLRAI